MRRSGFRVLSMVTWFSGSGRRFIFSFYWFGERDWETRVGF